MSTATKVTVEVLVEAIEKLGGSTTTTKLKDYFGIKNGAKLVGARRGAANKGHIREEGHLIYLVDRESRLKHRPNSTELCFEAFIDALINMGGEATTEELKSYFELDTGTQLSGVRSKGVRESLIDCKDGTYKLIDKWSDS